MIRPVYLDLELPTQTTFEIPFNKIEGFEELLNAARETEKKRALIRAHLISATGYFLSGGYSEYYYGPVCANWYIEKDENAESHVTLEGSQSFCSFTTAIFVKAGIEISYGGVPRDYSQVFPFRILKFDGTVDGKNKIFSGKFLHSATPDKIEKVIIQMKLDMPEIKQA